MLDTRFAQPARKDPGVIDGLLDDAAPARRRRRAHRRRPAGPGRDGHRPDHPAPSSPVSTAPSPRCARPGAGDTKAGTLLRLRHAPEPGVHTARPSAPSASPRPTPSPSAGCATRRRPTTRAASRPSSIPTATATSRPWPRPSPDGRRRPTSARFIDLYAEYNPDRNRGLDMWPLLGHLSPELAEDEYGKPIKNPRPTFHYRLPDSLVALEGWSPRRDLDSWERIERAADDPAAFERLRSAAERLRPLAHRRGRNITTGSRAVLGGDAGRRAVGRRSASPSRRAPAGASSPSSGSRSGGPAAGPCASRPGATG